MAQRLQRKSKQYILKYCLLTIHVCSDRQKPCACCQEERCRQCRRLHTSLFVLQVYSVTSWPNNVNGSQVFLLWTVKRPSFVPKFSSLMIWVGLGVWSHENCGLHFIHFHTQFIKLIWKGFHKIINLQRRPPKINNKNHLRLKICFLPFREYAVMLGV